MMEALFWCCALGVIYVYVGYPALLAIWSRLAPRPIQPGRAVPPVSIIVAARNEAPRLAGRLDNLLALDYPAGRMQIVVVSDGSDDGTPSVLSRYAGRVEAVLLPHGGKARALNAGVEAARHDVLVFADVRQRFAPDALRALVSPLADPAVGGVSGELVIDCEGGGATASNIGDGIGGYWRYEKWLRRHESIIGSTMGATGAIYALRRSLWQALPHDTILDDVLAPMHAVLSSSRVVFASEARAFDSAAPAATELRRKIRTLAGNYQILWQEPRLLNPFANPVWIQYVSHKIGRLVVPYALAGLLVASVSLSLSSPWYATALGIQLFFYALAAYGAYLDRCDRRLTASTDTATARPPHAILKGWRT